MNPTTRAGARRFCCAFASLLLLTWTALPAHAQSPAAKPQITRPSARIAHIAVAEAPLIDGNLSDAVWNKATVIDTFVQTDPNYGDKPTERTVVRVAYDENNFYISVHAYDSDPKALIATQKIRDGKLISDDRIKFFLDPNRTGRDAYSFEINPLGGYTEALLQNNTDFLINWNTIWYVSAHITEDGWTAEAAVPFRNLSFDAANDTWGFDFIRSVKRKDEDIRWASGPLGHAENDVSYAGTLTGFSGMNQGNGLDVQLYAAARYKRQSAGTPDNDVTFRPSGNLYYKLTPSLTATLTANTDFSDAPLDKRQVNTTRFSLFTDESRQFFLQDAQSFEFGGQGFTAPYIGGGGNYNNGRPFFSRNIGLVNGFPVSIVGGGKLSGELGGINIGALTVRTANRDGSDGQWLSVARLSMPVLAESKLGAVLTNGDPTGLSKSTVAGADFQFTDKNFAGTHNRVQADGYYLQSLSNVRNDDQEWGMDTTLPNEPFGGEFHFKHVGEDFVPLLGFVNRRGIEQYRSNWTYRERYRDSYLRVGEITTLNDVTYGLNGRLQSRDDTFGIGGTTTDGDTIRTHLHDAVENIDGLFFLPKHVLVPMGHYHWDYAHLHIDTSRTRPLAVYVDIDCCDFYNGHNFAPKLQFDYRPNETWSFNFLHEMQFIDLPTGSVNVQIATWEVITNFTPSMTLRTQLQYDNITHRFQALARYRWEYEPGQEIFVSVGDDSSINDRFFNPRYVSDHSIALIRLGHTFQF